MSAKRHILFTSVAAVFIGLLIVMTPTLLPGNQLGHTDEVLERQEDTLMPYAEPKAQINEFSGEPLYSLFIAEVDPNSSYGFHRMSLLQDSSRTPIFAVSRGEILTVSILITSLSDEALQISSDHIYGVPLGTTVKLKPDLVIIQPYEQKEVKMELTISQAASISTPRTIYEQNIIIPSDSNELASETTYSTKITRLEEKVLAGDYIHLSLRADNSTVDLGFFLNIT